MPPLLNSRKELLAHRYVQTLDWYEALRLADMLPDVPPEDADSLDLKRYQQAVERRIQYYKADKSLIARIAELQAQDSTVRITKQQLIAARLALAHAAMTGDDRFGYNAKEGRFEATGEKIRDYKAADGALAGVARMLGMDSDSNDNKGLVVVLPAALIEDSPQKPSEIPERSQSPAEDFPDG